MTTLSELASQLDTTPAELHAFIDSHIDLEYVAWSAITEAWTAAKAEAEEATSAGLAEAADADAVEPDALSGADDAEVTSDAAEAQPRNAYL